MQFTNYGGLTIGTKIKPVFFVMASWENMVLQY